MQIRVTFRKLLDLSGYQIRSVGICQAGMGKGIVRISVNSPEQREKIRAIREQTREERAAINQRLRATNRALEELLDSENPIEAVVEQRLREVAEAQAASMRIRVLTEFRIRRVLTPEQLTTLRTLRQNARDARRGRDWDNRDVEQREGVERQRGLRNQRNGLGPLFPRRADSPVKPRS